MISIFNLILLICFILLLSLPPTIYWLKNRKKIILPEGDLTEYTYKGFKSTVIVDNNIKRYNTGYIYLGKKITKTNLSKACAVSMEAADFVNKNFGPKNFQNTKKISECFFVFLDDDKFGRLSIAKGVAPTAAHAFADTINTKKIGSKIFYCCYIRAKYMTEIIKRGQLAIHEYNHCYSHKVTGNWDHEHVYLSFRAPLNDKNVDKIAEDRVKSIMLLDN